LSISALPAPVNLAITMKLAIAATLVAAASAFSVQKDFAKVCTERRRPTVDPRWDDPSVPLA
jgi:hypothetical protein